jgi:hypothetical protein
MAQVSLAEHDDMIKTFPSDRSRGSTKPRHATKPTKIRDVNFTAMK